MRTLRTLAVVALSVFAAVAVATTAAVADPAPDAARWHVTATLGLGSDDVATSCPTVSACTAPAGGELLTTADGGTTWTRSTPALPADVAAVVDLSCPTAAVCVVLTRRADGSTELLTGRGTGPFTAVTAPDAGTATAIACPGASHCLLTDGKTVWTTRDRGATWRASSLPAFAYSDQQLTCVAATNRCVVFGNNGFTPIVDVTIDDGRTWTQQDPGAFSGLYALDCPTVDVCVAGGRGSGSALLRRTTDGGVTWTGVASPGQPYGVQSISCATTTACSAFGLTPGDTPYAWSTTTGTSWTAQTVTVVQTTPSPAVDCPAAGRCRAVAGGIAYVTDDAGATWDDRSLPAVTQVPRAISCPRLRMCVAVGVDAVNRPLSLTSTDGGATWTPHPLPATLGQPTALDCATGTTTCVVMGAYAPPGNGRFVVRSAASDDLGVTWRTGRPNTVQGSLRALSCPTSTTCLAGGYDRRSAGTVWLTTDGARTWTVLTPPTGLGSVDGISCATTSSCVVIGYPGNDPPVAYTTLDLGTTWQPHPLPDDPDVGTDYYAVSCAATTCVAVGSRSGDGAIARSADGGVTWKRVAVPAAAQIIEAVSCASVTVCGATSFDFRPGGGPVAIGSRDGGVTWVVHPLDAGNLIGSDISCPTTRCYVPQLNPVGSPVVITGAV